MPIAPSLVNWLNALPIDDFDINPEIFSESDSYPAPEKTKDYWECLYHFAIHGDFEIVRALLALDTRYQ